MTTYSFSIPRGAPITVAGSTNSETKDAIDQLRHAVTSSGAKASISLGDPAECEVIVPSTGDMIFKLNAADLIEEFGM